MHLCRKKRIEANAERSRFYFTCTCSVLYWVWFSEQSPYLPRDKKRLLLAPVIILPSTFLRIKSMSGLSKTAPMLINLLERKNCVRCANNWNVPAIITIVIMAKIDIPQLLLLRFLETLEDRWSKRFCKTYSSYKVFDRVPDNFIKITPCTRLDLFKLQTWRIACLLCCVTSNENYATQR